MPQLLRSAAEEKEGREGGKEGRMEEGHLPFFVRRKCRKGSEGKRRRGVKDSSVEGKGGKRSRNGIGCTTDKVERG